MTTDDEREKQIRASLSNKEYRDALAVEHVNTTLAIQIRNLRENNNKWRQSDLAKHLGIHQETISQWENPDYGRHSITTLKKLAAAFDVALLVKFTPFSELVADMVNLSATRLSPPSYSDELLLGVLPISATSTYVKPTKSADANSILVEADKILQGTIPPFIDTTTIKETINA